MRTFQFVVERNPDTGLYVGEVVKASGAIEHFAPLPCHAFQKFQRAG